MTAEPEFAPTHRARKKPYVTPQVKAEESLKRIERLEHENAKLAVENARLRWVVADLMLKEMTARLKGTRVGERDFPL